MTLLKPDGDPQNKNWGEGLPAWVWNVGMLLVVGASVDAGIQFASGEVMEGWRAALDTVVGIAGVVLAASADRSS